MYTLCNLKDPDPYFLFWSAPGEGDPDPKHFQILLIDSNPTKKGGAESQIARCILKYSSRKK